MTGDAPKVSIIMNCYNCSRYLREAIDSVYAQTYKNWEIIFWDNASTDNSADIANSYDKKLRYFRGERTVPLYAARNLALRQAKGSYIALLDCDDMWLPTKLEEQIPLFDHNSEVGLVFSDSILFNEKGREKRFFQIVNPARGYVFPKLLLCNFVHLPTVAIRREALNNLTQCFDSRLNMLGDYDAWLRISHKWKVDYLDKPLAKYRVHRNSITNTNGRRLLADECDLVIENLKRYIPDVEAIYNKEIKLLKRRGDVHLALLDWESGNHKRARKLIKTYICDSAVHFILFFLMYFPYKIVFNPFYRLYNKNIMADQ